MTNRAIQPVAVGPLKLPRRNKYGVSAPAERTFDGKVYASKAEMIRAQELAPKSWLEDGDFEVVEQPSFHLGCRENKYVADFLIIPFAGQAWVEDVKGMETAAFKKNKKLWRRYGRLRLVILTRKGDGWEREVIDPERQA